MPFKRLADVSLTILQALSYGFFSYAVNDFNNSQPEDLITTPWKYVVFHVVQVCSSNLLWSVLISLKYSRQIFQKNFSPWATPFSPPMHCGRLKLILVSSACSCPNGVTVRYDETISVANRQNPFSLLLISSNKKGFWLFATDIHLKTFL